MSITGSIRLYCDTRRERVMDPNNARLELYRETDYLKFLNSRVKYLANTFAININ